MDLLDSYARMRTAPIGHAVAGSHFVHWCADAGLLGVTLWGHPSDEDVAQLLTILDAPPPASLAPRCSWIFDARRVGAIDREVFDGYLQSLAARRELLAARIERQVLVRPGGLPGAIVAGVAEVLGAGVPSAVFAELADGLRWLGRADAQELGDTLERLVDPLVEGDPLLARLRTRLEAEPLHVRIDRTARELGLAARSLQRHLHAHGTSFRAELGRARFTRACQLLAETDLKLEVIARRIGCKSAAHFATFFRARSGLPPSVWRESAAARTGRPDPR